jgi:hypothetical protein
MNEHKTAIELFIVGVRGWEAELRLWLQRDRTACGHNIEAQQTGPRA